jgi:HlyD family type I secretion membrane fusion protein
MSVLPFPKRDSSRGDDPAAIIDAFESETAEVLARAKPRVERITLYAVVAMVLLAFVLMAVTSVDRVATASGQIVPIEGTLVIQPYSTSIVNSVKVRVGQIVKKGEVLATLDSTLTGADLAASEAKLASAQAEMDRLIAEHDGKEFVPSATGPYWTLEQAMFRQRHSEYTANVANFDQQIQGVEADVNRLQKDMDLSKVRLKLAGDVSDMRQELEKREVGSRLNSLAAEDARLQADQAMATDQNTIATDRHQIESLRAQRDAYIQKWHGDVGDMLVTARDNRAAAEQDVIQKKKLQELTDLVAPEDAVVLKIGDGSAVGSVSEGNGRSPLFTLVPLNAPVEAEINIDEQDIGFVAPGDTVQVKLDAYPFMQHGNATGVVTTISEDSFIQAPGPQGGAAQTTLTQNATTASPSSAGIPYYAARVKFTDVNLHNVPKSFRLIPGMTVTGDIVVGRRTLLSYITETMFRTTAEAAREP